MYIIDMIHHNPGEEPFQSAFSEPGFLKEYGYNGQVFKHINTALLFEDYVPDLWEGYSKEKDSIFKEQKKIEYQNRKAKEAGLDVFYHIDLIVLPKPLVQRKNGICDPNTGRITLENDEIFKIHDAMFKELFHRFPEVDGLIIRVGETYLHDTPYHTGNGPVRYGENEKQDYIRLLRYLRDCICVRYNRKLFFRTWDCFPDKFHADASFYLDVTNEIEPHENLIFSIKHTALDFWRNVKVNPCLTLGKHKQVIEIQCQREYEGKGAFPNYIMKGVINGFEENKQSIGISSLIKDKKIVGLYSWTRGGGWYGPYINNELWCDLNAFVISGFFSHREETEEGLFYKYCEERLKLDHECYWQFRKLCLLSTKAVLYGRYCHAYDEQFNEERMPVNNWMRDDGLGGYTELHPVMEYLLKESRMEEALEEKADSVKLWIEIVDLSKSLTGELQEAIDYIRLSSEYGMYLFQMVRARWNIMAMEHGYAPKEAVRTKQDWESYYAGAKKAYEDLRKEEQCATLYLEHAHKIIG